MIEIPVYNHYNNTPSFDDKRLHFKGVIKYTCPKCKTSDQKEGSDFLYVPDTYKEVTFCCHTCDYEDVPLIIKDIRDGKVVFEKTDIDFKIEFHIRVLELFLKV